MGYPRATIAAVTALALGCGGVVLAGCGGGGGGSTTPATTAADGRNVYDPDHRVINLPPGPKFIIRMPAPGDGMRWRVFTAEDASGVGLSGTQNADGSGDWYFDTIGPGTATLEFRKTSDDGEEPSDTVTYEVNVE